MRLTKSVVTLETCSADGIINAFKIELAQKKLDIRDLLAIGTDNDRVILESTMLFSRN